MNKDLSTPSLIIEFAGLPGSGKTSLVSALEELAKDWEHTITWEYIVNAPRKKRFFRKLATFFYTLSALPEKSWLIIRECLRSYHYHPAACRDIINIFYLIYKYRQAANSSGSPVWIFDQGLVQAAWSVQMFGKEKSNLLELVLDELQLVVVVMTDPDLAWNRLKNRTYKGSRAQQNVSGEVFSIKASKTLDEILEQLKAEVPDENIVVVENNGSLEEVSDRISNWVFSRLESANQLR